MRDRLNATVRDPRVLALLPVLIAAALAYRAALTSDHYSSPTTRLSGAEEWLFSPVANSSPGLIYILAAWMAFRRFPRVFEALGDNGRVVLGAVGVATSLLLLVWSHYTSASDLTTASISLFIVFAGYFLSGQKGGRAMYLPAVFLSALAIPLPSVVIHQIIFPLQLFTAQLTTQILGAFGLPIMQAADLVLTREATFHVIETCSGFRIVQTLLMAAVVYAEIFHRSRRRLLLLVLAAPVVGIAVNIIRVISMVLNPGSQYMPVHTTQGIVMLVVGVLLLVAIDRVLDHLLPDPAVPERSSLPPQLSGMPKPPLPVVRIGLVTAGLLLTAVITFELPPWASERPTQKTVHALPRQFGGWTMQEPPLQIDRRYMGSTQFSQRTYRKYEGPGRETVNLFIGVNHRTDRLVSLFSPKTETLEAGNQIIYRESLAGREDGQAVGEMLIAGANGGRWLVHHWFVGVSSVPTETLRAALALDRSFLRRGDRSMVVRIATRVQPGREGYSQARERVVVFSIELQKQIELLEVEKTSPQKS